MLKKMNRHDVSYINRKAREVAGIRLVVCNVGLNWCKLEEICDTRGPSGERWTYDYDKSTDLYDNSGMLRDFKFPTEKWNGVLDIWVYSYELSSGPYRDPNYNLEFNLAATVENGRVTKVEE